MATDVDPFRPLRAVPRRPSSAPAGVPVTRSLIDAVALQHGGTVRTLRVRSSPEYLSAELFRRLDAADLDDGAAALDLVMSAVVDLRVADVATVFEESRTGVEIAATTDDLARALRQGAVGWGEGPSVDPPTDLLALDGASLVRRWPRWSRAAADRGVGAVIAVRLRRRGAPGVLALYYRSPRTLTTEDLDAARVAADHCAVWLAHVRHSRQLRAAIESRHRIGQAQGILMQRLGIDADTAFAALRRWSQQSNTKLAVVAEEIVARRELPERSASAGTPSA